MNFPHASRDSAALSPDARRVEEILRQLTGLNAERGAIHARLGDVFGDATQGDRLYEAVQREGEAFLAGERALVLN